jgi:hypothetical protein
MGLVRRFGFRNIGIRRADMPIAGVKTSRNESAWGDLCREWMAHEQLGTAHGLSRYASAAPCCKSPSRILRSCAV